MKYKLGDTVEFNYGNELFIGVICGVDTKVTSYPYLITIDFGRSNDSLLNVKRIFTGKETVTFLKDLPGNMKVTWATEKAIKNKVLPQKGKYYTVREEGLKGKKMIFLSSGNIEECGLREEAIKLYSDFSMEKNPFYKHSRLCFTNHKPLSRYFYPSPQEDIDFLESGFSTEKCSGTQDSKENTVYSDKLKNMKIEKWFIEIPKYGKDRDLVINWFINKFGKHGQSFTPGYFYANGMENKHTIKCSHSSDILENMSGFTHISLEYFKENILKINTMKNQTITREALKDIHDIACSTWKTKIEKLASRNPFENTIELSHAEVREMFNAADSNQKKVLEKYLKLENDFELNPKNNTYTLNGNVYSIVGDDCSSILKKSNDFPNKLILNTDFYFEFDKNLGIDYLSITPKK